MSTNRPVAVGVLGGTFDPVHAGHLQIANAACHLLDLPRTLLVPTALPPHKSPVELCDFSHRQRMLELAAADEPRLEVQLLESDTARPSYTIDTLISLRELQPPLAPVFILGMDSLQQLGSWHRWQELISQFDLAVIDRPVGSSSSRIHPEVASRIVSIDELSESDPPPGSGGRIFRLPIEAINVSSSEIRGRIAHGEPWRELVPPSVARYIQRASLYLPHQGAAIIDAPSEVIRGVEAAVDKKALDPVLLDLRGISDVTDYFLICHGTSDRHVLAIAENIEDRLRTELNCRPKNVEGRQPGDWVLLDYYDFVVHVFREDRRQFYRLESLWGDAPTVDIEPLMPTLGDAEAPSI